MRSKATVDLAAIEALRPAIRTALQQDKTIARLSGPAGAALEDDLVDAVGFAKAGLRPILTGKRTRSAAWTMDIFVRDVCDALLRAGLSSKMDADPQASLAQSLALAVALVTQLPRAGNLFKQMQRGRKITKRRNPDIVVTGTIAVG